SGKRDVLLLLLCYELMVMGMPQMVWPRMSPDQNPMYVWDQLKQRLGECDPPPRDLTELPLVEEWNSLTNNNIMRLMRHHCQDVFAANAKTFSTLFFSQKTTQKQDYDTFNHL
uniref:Uncharacterized protein n=1 Tax=Oryzias latipes TaxID=8090 RepID=A0A3P9KFW6_ORYLA